MKIITDIKEANNILQSYIGANVKIAFYTESLKKIAIRVMLPNVNEIIYLVGGSCDYINGRFNFSNANLSIIADVDKNTKEDMTRIFDKISGFELITSDGFTLVQGIESEFGNSFENSFENFVTNK
jgi:hypothetical protein